MKNFKGIEYPHYKSQPNSKIKYRYKDSKYLDPQPSLSTKKKINPKEKFELALENLIEGLSEISKDFKERYRNNNESALNIMANYSKDNKKNLSYSKPHYKHLNSYKKNKYDLERRNLHKPILKHNLYDNILTSNSNIVKINNRYNTYNAGLKINFIEPNHQRIGSNSLNHTNSKDKVYSNFMNYNDNEIKSRELTNMNLILKKQNKELREKSREDRYKVKDLLNNIKLLRMDNQRLKNEKNKLLIKITNLENELDISKNLSMNELELKSNQISELKEELIKLNFILEEKENEIIFLKNRNANEINNLNEFNDEEEIIIPDLKTDNEKSKRNEENRKNNNEFVNGRISNIIKENQKYVKLYNNLKIEYNKLKNYILKKKSQNNSLETQKSEFSQNIFDLSQKVNSLTEENNSLKNSIINYKQNIFKTNNNINQNQLKSQIKKLM